MEIITNDSIRNEIISLYEQDYYVLRKLEEEYSEMQYHRDFFKELNEMVSPDLIFNRKGELVSLNLPISLTEIEKQVLLSYLWNIKRGREFILDIYRQTEQKMTKLIADIETLKAKD